MHNKYIVYLYKLVLTFATINLQTSNKTNGIYCAIHKRTLIKIQKIKKTENKKKTENRKNKYRNKKLRYFPIL